ncbi:MAG: hypothetical protein WDW36_007862 [Sanguina aurantia]
MVQAVEFVADVELPCQGFGKVPFHMRGLCTVFAGAYSQRGAAPEAPHPATRAEHALFVADLVSLLTALLPQLRRCSVRLSLPTGSCSIGTDEEELFWELWSFLHAGCSALSLTYTVWPSLWPYDQRPFDAPLVAAFHAVLTWLLSFSRSPAWVAMTAEHGLAIRNHELIIILMQPMTCVGFIHHALPHASLVTQLRALPGSFFPLLCCIATEQFGGAPVVVPPTPAAAAVHGLGGRLVPATTYTKDNGYGDSTSAYAYNLFILLATAVNNFLAAAEDRGDGYGGPFAFLRSPSVAQLLKVVLTLPEESPPAWPNPMHCGINSLHALLTLSRDQTQSSPGRPVPLRDRVTNRDAEGLPLHLDPLLSPAALETDARVLHVLSRPMEEGVDALLLLKRHTLQAVILQLWVLAGRAHPLTHTALASMTSSVVGLAKRCAWQGLRMMREQQQQQRRESIHGLQAEERQQAALPGQHASAQLAYVRLAALGREGMREMRGMMYTTSNFQMHNERNNMRLKVGPEYAALNAWCAMPGWAAVTELLQRGEHPADHFLEASNAALSAYKCLNLTYGTRDPAMLREKISLAATVRKLVWPFMRHHQRQPVPDAQRNRSLAAEVAPLLDALVKGVMALQYAVQDGIEYISTGTGGIGDAASSSGWRMGQVAASPGQHGAGQDLALPRHLLHQLQAVALVTLVQASVWRMRTEGLVGNALRVATPDWLTNVLTVVERLPNEGLKQVAMSMLRESLFRPPQQTPLDVGVRWERYAVVHFHGRLLPGCCNLDCSNLSGLSEAALGTLLCGGCKRARYCSVACQRAGWRVGGHSTVCGKQGCN